MLIKNNKITTFFLSLFFLAGCSSTMVKNKNLTTNNESKPTKTTITKSTEIRMNPLAFNYYVNGVLYETLSNIPAAAESYKKALQFYPNSYQIRYSLAQTYYKMKRFRDVLDLLDVISPKDGDVYIMRGACYYALGEKDSSEMAYHKLVEIEPNKSTGYSYLVGFYSNKKDLDSLIWAYKNLTRTEPLNYRYWSQLGKLQVQKEDYSAAKISFEKAIDIDNSRSNIMSYVNLGEIYRISNHYDSAINIYQQAYIIDSNDFIVNKELALLYVHVDSLLKALPYAKKVVAISPLDRSEIRRLGIIYYSLDSLRQADSVFTYLVKSGEMNPVNYYYLGRIALLNKDYLKAVDEFTTLTDMADTVSESWLNLGYAYRQLKKPEKEILTYQTSLGHVTNEKDTLQLMFALGAAYEQNNQIEKAESAFENILKIDPNYVQALNYLGYMLADRGTRLNYAQKLIEKAIKKAPNNAAYLDSYGWVFYRMGKYNKALKYLKKAVSLDNDPTIFNHLGDIYKAKGNLKNARQWWQKALKLAPNNDKIKRKLNQ